MPIQATTTAQDIGDMARHWLGCPPNGYLGSDYGAPTKDLLQAPLSSGVGDDFIAKFRQDVPPAANAPAGAVNVYAVGQYPDILQILFEVTGNVIPVAAP